MMYGMARSSIFCTMQAKQGAVQDVGLRWGALGLGESTTLRGGSRRRPRSLSPCWPRPRHQFASIGALDSSAAARCRQSERRSQSPKLWPRRPQILHGFEQDGELDAHPRGGELRTGSCVSTVQRGSTAMGIESRAAGKKLYLQDTIETMCLVWCCEPRR